MSSVVAVQIPGVFTFNRSTPRDPNLTNTVAPTSGSSTPQTTTTQTTSGGSGSTTPAG